MGSFIFMKVICVATVTKRVLRLQKAVENNSYSSGILITYSIS